MENIIYRETVINNKMFTKLMSNIFIKTNTSYFADHNDLFIQFNISFTFGK